MQRLNKKLPDLRHRFERFASQRIHVHGNAPPTHHPQLFTIRRDINGCAEFHFRGSRKKRKSNPKMFRQLDLQFLRALAKELLRQRSQQSGAIAAGAVRVHATTVRQPL